jgi:RNA polymerase sigma factor (sigma-70 family)
VQFEAYRARLRSVAYRMLGSLGEAEDAVQEAWVRLSQSDWRQIENLGGWLTTAVSRICLNMLRSRTRQQEATRVVHMPDPIVSAHGESGPEDAALLADSVGLALMVVLDRLRPAERVAFVLHDLFDVPFDDIASIAGRTPPSVRQLASRARRRVSESPSRSDVDLSGQRKLVDAFYTAARCGDFEALVALLDPDVVLRSDGGPRRPAQTVIVEGAAAVAAQARTYARLSPFVHPVVVNGAAGAVVTPNGKPVSLMAFTVREGLIVAIDILADPDRLSHLDLSFLDPLA